MLRRILLVLVIAALLLALIIYSQIKPRAGFVSGVLQAPDIRVGSRLGGRVQKVLVSEGQAVTTGMTLIELEPYDVLDREQEAVAELASREAELALLKAGTREQEIGEALARYQQTQAELELLEAGPREEEKAAAKSRLVAAKSEEKRAQAEYDRVRPLAENNAASQTDLDRSTERLAAATANVNVRENELAILMAGARPQELAQARAKVEEAKLAWELAKAGSRIEDIHKAEAARDAAKAALAAIRTQKQELKITAPVDGYVDALDLEPGDLVTAGAPVLTIVANNDLWVRAYVPQELMQIKLGQPLKVTIDTYPDWKLQGTVSFISQVAEFTPSNVQTSEDRARQVFRIKVTLENPTGELKPGMTANVWLGEAGRE